MGHYIFEPWPEISNNAVSATRKGSDQPAHTRSLKLLTEHCLECLNFKGGCTGSPESTLVKMTHCLKSHVMAHLSMCDGDVEDLPIKILIPLFTGENFIMLKSTKIFPNTVENSKGINTVKWVIIYVLEFMHSSI